MLFSCVKKCLKVSNKIALACFDWFQMVSCRLGRCRLLYGVSFGLRLCHVARLLLVVFCCKIVPACFGVLQIVFGCSGFLWMSGVS